jgi:hypothetical protein
LVTITGRLQEFCIVNIEDQSIQMVANGGLRLTECEDISHSLRRDRPDWRLQDRADTPKRIVSLLFTTADRDGLLGDVDLNVDVAISRVNQM